ncbi:MAG: hypothetical protein GEU80_14860 [Dehalococcoidia bacterium]|nr:hypothetical protein [Dehalococcoidia bacterium]
MTLARRLRGDAPALRALAAIAVLLLTAFAPIDFGPADAEQDLLLVADLRGHALVLVDPAAPEAVGRIPLPGGPHELLRLPDGRVAATLEQAGLLALVDVARREVQTVDLGGLPHGMAVDGDLLYITDRASNVVRRLDLQSWVERDPLPAGAWPHAVGVLASGALVVAHAEDATLAIGPRVLSVSALPETLTVAPSGDRVATAGALGGRLEVFDASGEPLWDATVGGRPVRALFGPDGAVVAVALSATGRVALVSAPGTVRTVAVGGTPDGLAFDATGDVLYVADMYSGEVAAVDVASGAVTARLDAGESAGSLLIIVR